MRLLKIMLLIVLASCSIAQVFAQQMPDSILKRTVDSLPLQIKAKAATVINKLKVDATTINIPSDTVLAGKLIAIGRDQAKPIIDIGKGLLTQASSLTKLFDKGKTLKIDKLEIAIDYDYLGDTSTINLAGYNGPLQNNVAYNFGFGATVANLPFSVEFSGNNSNYNLGHTTPNNLTKLNFDHKKYIEDIKSKTLQKINPETCASSTINRLNSIKSGYQQMLTNDIAQIKADLGDQYKQQLNLPEDITSLDITDVSTLKNKIMSAEVVGRYKASMDRMQEMMKTTDVRTLQSDPEFQSLLGNVKEYESMEKIYSKILSWQERFNNNKAVKLLRSQLPFSPGNFKSYLNDPSNLNAVLKEHANLSSIQNLFTKITKLDLGQNAVENGQFDVNNLINTGLNTEFKSDKLSLAIIAGKNDNVNNWLQSGLVNTATTEYSKLTGIKLGTGNNATIGNALSLNVFEFTNTPGYSEGTNIMQPAYLPVAPHKDAVIALQTTYPIAANHNITVDVSKSIGLYSNNASADSSFSKSNPVSSLFGSQGKSNYSGMISYTGEINETSVSITIKKVGLGYSNPGNAFLRKGESNIGVSLARKFLQNKLSVKYSADYRSQHFDPQKNYTYSSFSNKGQLSYRVNRDTRLKITYEQSGSQMKRYNQQGTNGKNTHLQMDAGYRFKINGLKITNNAGLGISSIRLPLLTGGSYQNKSYNIMHVSSVVLAGNILSVNFLASRSDNKEYYFNTSVITAEANYSYILLKKFHMGSGAGYYANAGWNKQVGVKQQLSTILMQNLSIDIETGYKKAVKTYRQELANLLYMNAGIRYHF
jgi:hypothetical protein